MTELAARAKEAQDRAAAAQNKAKAELEKDVKTARDSSKARDRVASKVCFLDGGVVAEEGRPEVAFERVERHSPQPILPLSMLRHHTLALGTCSWRSSGCGWPARCWC